MKLRLVAKKYNQESIPIGCVPPDFGVRGEWGRVRVYTPRIPYPLDILPPILNTLAPGYITPQKEHGTRDTLPQERTCDQRYPTPFRQNDTRL